MSVEHVEVLVEEPSAEAALLVLLPKMLTTASFNVHPHQGKSDLLAKLPGKLRGYAAYMPETWRILVVVDRDNDDCRSLRRRLEGVARDARLSTGATTKKNGRNVVNRIAIEELEAWYFGDWLTVRAAYPRVTASIPVQSKYRHPDAIEGGGTWEAFERVMKKAGYFRGGLRKIEAARAIAERMDPSRNSSPSFRALRSVLERIATL